MRLRIKEARVAAGKKQREVAEALGISQPYFAQIERGERRLNTEYQERLAKILDVRATDLVDFDAPTPEDEAFLLDVFRNLPRIVGKAGWIWRGRQFPGRAQAATKLSAALRPHIAQKPLDLLDLVCLSASA